MTRHRSPHRSPLLVLALGAVVGLAAGGGDPATAASGPELPAVLAAAPVSVSVPALPAAPRVVPEPLAVRGPLPAATSPGVPVAPWQLADPSAGPVAGDVEGDPQAVAVPPSLEVTEALQRLRTEATRTAATGRGAGPTAVVALGAALDQVGDPYVWGATGPDAFDCSGLTSWSYARAGVVIPRVSRDQFAFGGAPVDVDDLLPGDLVFFATAEWDPGVVHHVGMYVGEGLMVAAPRSGLTVRVEPVPAAHYVGAVRPVPARGPVAADDGDGDSDQASRPGRPAGRPSVSSSAPTAGTSPAPGTPSPTTTSPTPAGTATTTTPDGGSVTAPDQPSATPAPIDPSTPSPTVTSAPTATLTPVTPLTLSPVVTATLVATPRVPALQAVAPVVVRP